MQDLELAHLPRRVTGAADGGRAVPRSQPAEQQIQQARDELVPVSYLPGQVSDTLDAENPVNIEWSQGGSNP